jgi:hypothetical protein
VSLFLFAVGAILAFAVEASTEGIDLNAVGVILMIVGVIGLLVSMMLWSSWSPWYRRREETIVEDVHEPHAVHHHH